MLGGCGTAGSGTSRDDLDQLRQLARDALARYDKAVLDAGQKDFVPVGDLTGQLGNWESTNENGKLALLYGRVLAAAALPTAPRSTGEVVWENGASQAIPLLSAGETLKQLTAGGRDCPECVPLEVTGARLTTTRIQTTRGPATAPAWEYTLKGTAVRLTRVPVPPSSAVKVTPLSWDLGNEPGGVSIESATMHGGQLTANFVGSPHPGSQPCGADYSAEAVESANAVAVIVIAHPHAGDEICTAVGALRTATVDLAQPLGTRAVLEARQGLPVPLKTTG
ncbi:hypothetical protein Aple_028800 [Acrocarpospora pleiomorpha]|uniref:Uncharacterized protein n=2 Tax=Acrocarpospora pleiomorpha TaxID=90975 RepID=A0A5M3XFD0_9ACTN|nr:hypothetical protein Aple_028800 [Acrocarpospora pleiomorpha]